MKPSKGPWIAYLAVEGALGPLKNTRVENVELVDDRRVRHVFKNPTRNKLENLMRILDDYDILITWGGARKDLPLLTACCIRLGVDPSPLHALAHLDLQEFVKDKLGIVDAGLEETAEFLKAGRGGGKVYTLMRVFKKLRGFVRSLRPELAL
ncbi:MAG: hypothetical protein QXO30_00215 [Candidatus Caldarchaeum sp.]